MNTEFNDILDFNSTLNHDGTGLYHYLGEVCPEKLWEHFEKELKKANITVLCGNASMCVESANTDGVKTIFFNKVVRTNVSEEKLVTAALYYTLNHILIDLLTKNHNCISVREPIHVRHFAIDGEPVYRVYIRYLTGKDIDAKAFKAKVKRLTPHIF